MSQEKKNWNNSDTGILRKKDESDTELLIFGYSCKLFRDDAKALDIDQGKHLIPWMGDETLKIDRYDVRGALYDISKYEANILDSSISWDALSSEERKVELMCNEERYRALYHNEEEEALYQEEELKRLHQILDDKEYGQVAYQYQEKPIGSSSNLRKTGDNSSDNGGDDDSDDDNSDEIFIPLVQLDIPQNMIIPKTKKQNAIIEKTALFIHKQGPQMEILLKMKQASNPQFQFLSISCPLHSYYRHVLAVIKTGRYIPTFTDEDSDGGNKYEDDYLHPSLLPTKSSIEVAPLIPSIAYKPSADCAYSRLVNKIKGNNQEKEPTEIKSTEVSSKSVTTTEIFSAPVRYPLTEEISNKSNNKVDQSFQLISKASKRRRRKKNQKDQDQTYTSSKIDQVHSSYKQTSPVQDPPHDIKVIIDKMATYVLKNGQDFETLVKNKGDPRFLFLNCGHEHHKYYAQQVNQYNTSNPYHKCEEPVTDLSLNLDYKSDSLYDELERENNNFETSDEKFPNNSYLEFDDKNDSASEYSSQSQEEHVNHEENLDQNSSLKTVPVCFSIKKPKEVDKLEHLSALPVEESSGGEGSHNEDDHSHKDDKAHKGNRNRKSKSHSSTKSKRVEERVKDKLAHVAKEKLTLKEREKQLQIERKKRALAFLNRLRKENSSPVKGSYSSSGRTESSSLSKGKSSVVYISSGHSSENDSSSRGLSSRESDENKTRASQTLQRILGAVPKNNRDDKKLLHEISSTSRSYYSKSRSEYSSKHNHHHHKRHKRHYYDDDYKSMRKHKKKSHKRHKSNKRSPSVEYVVIE